MTALKSYEEGKILVTDEAMERLGLHNKTHYCNSIVEAIKLATQHRNITYGYGEDEIDATFIVNTGIGQVVYKLNFHAAIKEPIAIIGRLIKHINDRYNEILSRD
jgi:hypothetical protein